MPKDADGWRREQEMILFFANYNMIVNSYRLDLIENKPFQLRELQTRPAYCIVIVLQTKLKIHNKRKKAFIWFFFFLQ